MDADVVITGFVGTPVELRTQPGAPWRFADFRLACTPRRRTKEGEWIDHPTTWITVQARGLLADHVTASVHKGDAVVAVGKLRTLRYRSSDGADRERLLLDASVVGHDLNRGVTVFSKAPRDVPGSEPSDVHEPEEGRHAEAARDAVAASAGPPEAERDHAA